MEIFEVDLIIADLSMILHRMQRDPQPSKTSSTESQLKISLIMKKSTVKIIYAHIKASRSLEQAEARLATLTSQLL